MSPFLTHPIAAGDIQPLPIGGTGSIAAKALADAQALSDAFGGTALLIWRDGALAYEHYAEGFDAASPLHAFSMGKTVLGLAYGLAVDKGVVSVTDPLSLHLEEWRDDPRGAITLEQLLQMRSGLKLYSLEQGDPQAIHLVFGEAITEAALATPLESAPGERFEYSNVNAFLAGLALDRALDRAGLGSYVAFLEQELWRPLGQGAASLAIDGPGGIPRFFAGLNAAARDWLRLGLLFVEGGEARGERIIPASWITAMTTPSPNPNYGYCVWLGQPWTPERAYGPNTPTKPPCLEPYLAEDMVFFDGFGGQRVYASARHRLVIVRTGEASKAWEDSGLPNTVMRGFL
jgi:CubicO group peptidase (beta-lactamase class C family)